MPRIADYFNQFEKPLVISLRFPDEPFSAVGNTLSLANRLDPKVKFQLALASDIPRVPQGYSDMFLLDPRNTAKLAYQKDFQLQPISTQNIGDKRLWQLSA